MKPMPISPFMIG
ncbi:hypothetical protein CGLO_14198 [Colletotrichum gloeosporioides Cg-14]|uniref:Uncharacterized protein n=1 Tax=Colletotrichum gloeosporioides (strain Cg-14) TaxID=1237896 RepID=T0K1Y8_COLGC|nr:hypothetical protein CGLO_14198 [Colletotrichum gloeosporioides Cg-14]